MYDIIKNSYSGVSLFNKTKGEYVMTDTAKLDLILEKISGLDTKVTDLDTKVTNLDAKVTGLDTRMTALEQQQIKDVTDLKAMFAFIYDEVERVHGILLKRTDKLADKVGIRF